MKAKPKKTKKPAKRVEREAPANVKGYDVLAWTDRHIARWILAKTKAWSPSRVEKCDTALVVLNSLRAYIMGEPEVPLPNEYDPEKWVAQTTRQA